MREGRRARETSRAACYGGMIGVARVESNHCNFNHCIFRFDVNCTLLFASPFDCISGLLQLTVVDVSRRSVAG